MPVNDPRGSIWRRWDLHFHTPSSCDYGDKGRTNGQIVEALVDAGIAAVAITDHHIIDVARIRSLQERAGDKLTVFPGMELRSDQGGDKPIHFIAIFPEDVGLEHVWTTLQGRLALTEEGIKQGGGQEKISFRIAEVAGIVHDLGGLISIHAGSKSNSIEGIKNREQFQERIKYNLTRDHVDLLEIGQIKDVGSYRDIVFPATGLNKPLLICSDNHNAAKYEQHVPMWVRADPTFRGLRMVCCEPQDRVFLGDEPPDLKRLRENPTKYAKSVSFNRRPSAPDGAAWLDGSVPLNPGLVAIVGNKGAGKSALADTLGLLGASKNTGSFSFLSPKRFRDPVRGLAQHFEATLEWQSGERAARSLAEPTAPHEPERIRCLPQDHIESVCNELAGPGGGAFERELAAVIFSHVPEADRLGCASLEELVKFRTNEGQRRIDTLVAQLRELSRDRASLEHRADPATKRDLEEDLGRRQAELEAHEKAKPAEVPAPPAEQDSAEAGAARQSLADLETQRGEIAARIAATEAELGGARLKQASAARLLEKLENLRRGVEAARLALEPDAAALGLDAAGLVALEVRDGRVQELLAEQSREAGRLSEALDGEQPPGLQRQLRSLEETAAALRAALDAPARAHQTYLANLRLWAERRSALLGNPNRPDSIEGVKALLAQLGSLPERIAEAKAKQAGVAEQVFAEKKRQADVLSELYRPVQQFINSYGALLDGQPLQFRADLAQEGFAEGLLSFLALNRKGSFMGVDEGRARAEGLAGQTDWQDPDGVAEFLSDADKALHADLRDGPGGAATQLADQVARDSSPEGVFDFLYGLGYLRPRYSLRWEGKDVALLSPGERGSLLLVFYLLVDKGDVPIVIDQPEGNLDNMTISRSLVACIRRARSRRQIVIVTHNPNLAVLCDADQIVRATIDKANGNAIRYETGSLESPAMAPHVTDVLEGTRPAFGKRDKKYQAAD